jgi:hypothetical protein
MRLYPILLLFGALLSCKVHSQSTDSFSIKSLLTEIGSLQSIHSYDFPDGAFPSYRKYHFGNAYKADDNFFYTAITLFNLQRYRNFLTAEEKKEVDQIREKALPYFEIFRSKLYANRYNFWKKSPPVVFPNSGWLNLFNKVNALPDDVDDCSMAMLVIGPRDSSLYDLKQHFLQYSNGSLSTCKSFYKQYRNSPVYNTWLGKNMPIDIDLCVLANVMLMNSSFGLSMTKTDTASLDLLVDMVKANKHITASKYVSPHYENPATILYHIARLMTVSDYKSLLEVKPLLVSQAKELLLKSTYNLEKLLLSNALLQLGESDIGLFSFSRHQMQENDYPFFIASMASILPNPYKRIFSAVKIGRFSYYSYPFNLSLLYENKLLRERVNK